MVTIKRIYDEVSPQDGYRVLVDRLWPRGVSKEKAHLDLWLKEIAPSTKLRLWFGHDPHKWNAFVRKYTNELRENKELLSQLKDLIKEYKDITLLYAAKDTKHNEAVILADILNTNR